MQEPPHQQGNDRYASKLMGSQLMINRMLVNVGRSQVWSSLRDELREIVWLASIVGGLSIMGVALAVILAQALARLPAVHVQQAELRGLASDGIDRPISADLRVTSRAD